MWAEAVASAGRAGAGPSYADGCTIWLVAQVLPDEGAGARAGGQARPCPWAVYADCTFLNYLVAI